MPQWKRRVTPRHPRKARVANGTILLVSAAIVTKLNVMAQRLNAGVVRQAENLQIVYTRQGIERLSQLKGKPLRKIAQ